MLFDLALIEDNMFFRINARGDECGGNFPCIIGQLFGALPHRHGMQINNAINALVGFLQSNEVFDRAKIISQMQVSGWLYTGKDAVLNNRVFYVGHFRLKFWLVVWTRKLG